jgi:hypothetical protein
MIASCYSYGWHLGQKYSRGSRRKAQMIYEENWGDLDGNHFGYKYYYIN